MVWWGAWWGTHISCHAQLCRSRALGRVLSPEGHPVGPSTLVQMELGATSAHPLTGGFSPSLGSLAWSHPRTCADGCVWAQLAPRHGSELLLAAPSKDAQSPRGPSGPVASQVPWGFSFGLGMEGQGCLSPGTSLRPGTAPPSRDTPRVAEQQRWASFSSLALDLCIVGVEQGQGSGGAGRR